MFEDRDKLLIPVPLRKIDQTVEVVQGKSDTVAKLFQDYVLGRLDPSQIGGSPVYDPDGSDEVDDFNHFGLELEDVTKIGDKGKTARQEIENAIKKPKQDQEPKSDPKPDENPNN